MSTFKQATAVRKLTNHAYAVELLPDWCIGSVPHGGYVTSCFMSVAKAHFNGTLSQQMQLDTMSLHLEFVRRTEIGPALFTVKDVKLGRATSTISVTLSQRGRDEVMGYLTNTNMNAAQGLTIETNWRLHPPSPPISPEVMLSVTTDSDPNWKLCEVMPFRDFRPAAEKVYMFFPRRGQLRSPALLDQWMRFRNHERFTDTTLGYVVDNFAQIIEVLTSEVDPYSNLTLASEAKGLYWYPTLLLNLEVKQSLPEEGVEWLLIRAQPKRILNGRYDLEVTVMDENNRLIAISHHVCMILDAERNTAKRSSNSSKL